MTLRADPSSARSARRFAEQALRKWHASALTDVACLLISEVVTNALLHAGTEIHVVLTFDRGTLRCAVTDQGAGVPVVRPLDDEALSGRGLALVDGLAAAWGVDSLDGGGKTVWFELAAASDRDLVS